MRQSWIMETFLAAKRRHGRDEKITIQIGNTKETIIIGKDQRLQNIHSVSGPPVPFIGKILSPKSYGNMYFTR